MQHVVAAFSWAAEFRKWARIMKIDITGGPLFQWVFCRRVCVSALFVGDRGFSRRPHTSAQRVQEQ